MIQFQPAAKVDDDMTDEETAVSIDVEPDVMNQNLALSTEKDKHSLTPSPSSVYLFETQVSS